MNHSTRRSALGAIIAAPLAAASKPAEASASLLRLCEDYEALHRKLDDACNRLDDEDGIWSDLTRTLVRACGRMRTTIAFYPANSIADVMLKVRCFSLDDNALEGWQELKSTIEYQNGHAYDMDVAHAVMLDLMRLGRLGSCV